MEFQVKTLPPEVLIPELLALLDQTESVPLVISGSSMTPFLVHGRDTVFLSAVTVPLKRGDMILYRRLSGQYVLHRICRVSPDCYDLVGDAQTEIERGIRPDQVLAVVNAVRRKGIILKKGDFWWDFFEGFWLKVIPLRPVLRRIYGLFSRK